MKGMTLNMDIKIDKIFTGMDNGAEKINQNFSNVSEAFDNLAQEFSDKDLITNWKKDGIVFESGFVDFPGKPSGYRYIKFPNGVKLVELSLHSTLTQGINGYGGGGWVKLPDIIAPISWQLAGGVSGKYFYSQSSNNELSISKTDGGDWDQNNYEYSIHAMYFA
ncbi:hypothetical protein [Limosilactobacillus fastidiosus]|uniref:Bacterial toxin 44 domain-containing protein n=1 Tax=Limosilactobacillus fastidiosus TaxID=2759855 RepID=A0ABR6E9Q7_9LACO|nr:hypothetical protein [Limosilactobacillus fastidiosus]MBB1063651.1 hypothetical protein [Limosilactobacillus fastidiosus]MCD7084226.1 hypothetical protein [Limosilactobacillus fastidiosus]